MHPILPFHIYKEIITLVRPCQGMPETPLCGNEILNVKNVQDIYDFWGQNAQETAQFIRDSMELSTQSLEGNGRPFYCSMLRTVN